MKNYEAIKPAELLNEEGESIRTVGVGLEFTGEPIEIDGEVYLETADGFIKMDALAETVDEASEASETTNQAPATSSSRKLILALVGLAVGFGFAKYKKMGTKGIVIASVIGVGAGLAIDYFYNKSKK